MKIKYLLILIIMFAAVLRLWNLGNYPALNADEASNSYDAYSLIQTGMDQHSHVWPITFQSFNDYKPGLYVYLDIPFIKLFGLNIWSARLPGAILGIFSVALIYLLVVRLFNDEKFGLISAFFLAISPWHIHFSRGAWEVNIATTFILLGVYIFLVFLRSKNLWHLLFSVLSLILALYAYHAARVILPLLGISTILIYRKIIFTKANSKNLIMAAVFGLLFTTPLILDLLSPGALSRVAGVGLFADRGPVNRINEQRGEHNSLSSFSGKLLHNKIANYALAFGNNYLTHFNGEFLFMSGDSIERNKVPETGEMYLFDIIFLALGFMFLSRKLDENWSFILCWLFIAPVASSLTFQSPNALRSQNMVIPLIIICSYGCYQVIKWLKTFKPRWLKIFGLCILGVLVIWNFARYLNMYYIHMTKVYPYSSQYGVKELVEYVSENESKYSDIYVTNRYDQPYVLFLFYKKYSPQNFQFHHSLTTRDEFGFSTVSDFDKYHFGSINFSSMQNNYSNSIIIGTPEEIPQTANIIKRIYGTNGFEYFDVVSN